MLDARDVKADLHDCQVSADQSGRLAMSMERLDQSSDRIRESRRLMLETEEVGISVVENLSQQRQTLLHAHSKVIPYKAILQFIRNGSLRKMTNSLCFGVTASGCG